MQYFIIALLITNAATGGISYYQGGKHATNAIRAEQLEYSIKSIEQANDQVIEDQEIIKAAEIDKQIIKTVYIKVRADADANINQNPSYDECGLDDVGLELFNKTINKSAMDFILPE